MKLSSGTKSLFALATLFGVATMSGCTAPLQEARGSTTNKLLAPQAVFKGAATAQTKAAFGISEWRIYRGKTDYIVTGYNTSGKAVKGFALKFAGSTGTSTPALQARVLDGSKVSATHFYGGPTFASAPISSTSSSFLNAVSHDMTALRMNLTTSLTRSAVASGDACDGDTVKIVMNSAQCTSNAQTSGSSVSKKIKLKQCAAAAQNASRAVLSCQNAQTRSATTSNGSKSTNSKENTNDGGTAKTSTKNDDDDTKTSTTKKDTDDDTKTSTTKKDTDDDTKTSSTTDKQKAADKKQDTEQDAADAKAEAADKKQDAEQDAADQKEAAAEKTNSAPDNQKAADQQPTTQQDAADTAADQAAAPDAQKASKDTTCASCNGDATDVRANAENGAVSSAADGASSSGADTSGSSGNSDVGSEASDVGSGGNGDTLDI